MTVMQLDERDALLAKPLDAILAVSRRSGGPQLTPVWFHWDGEAFYFSTTRSRSKYPNLRRHPQSSVIVDDQAAHHYVAAYGHAEIVEDDRERILSLTRPIMAKYAPDPDRTAQMLERMEDDRVVIILRPERIVTN
jgi:PPOX class probable F420-dependent enzyme